MKYFATLGKFTIYMSSTKKVKVLDRETGKTYNYTDIFERYNVLRATAYYNEIFPYEEC